MTATDEVLQSAAEPTTVRTCGRPIGVTERVAPWRTRVAPALLTLSIAIVVHAATGAAQTPVPEPTAASAAWIRPEEVAIRADRLARALASVPPGSAVRETVRQIDADLAEAAPSIETLLERAHATLARSTPFVELEDLQRELAATDAMLGKWSIPLEAEAKRIADALDEIARTRAEWLETQRHSETAAAGESVVRRVDASLAALDEAVASLRPWRAEVLALSDRVIDRRSAVAGGAKKLQEASAREWTHLFEAGREPLWRTNIVARVRSELPRVPALMAAYARSTRAYVERDVRPLLLQLAVAVLLMVVLRSIARRTPGGSPRVPHPYATAWLLVLLVTPWFHPLAPQRFRQVLAMAALVPAGRILRAPAGPPLPIGMVGFFVLLLVDRLTISLAPLPAVARASSLLGLGVGIALAARAMRRAPRIGAPVWVTRAARFAGTGLVLALVAEIGGWDGLAAVLGRGIVGGALLAVFFGAAIIGVEPVVLHVFGTPLLRRRLFGEDPAALRRRVGMLLRVAGSLAWLTFLLRGVGLEGVAADGLRTVLAAGISIGALSISVSTVLAFGVTLFATTLLARTVTGILEQDVYPHAHLPRGVPFVLSTFARYTVYSIGVFFALAAAGIQLGQLAIVLGGVGVGVGLGLQDLVKNFAAGLTLLLERRVHPGDVVQIPSQEIFGRIMAIGMRATLVRAWDGSEIVVPNGDLIARAITNWTLTDRLCRLEVSVGVAYGTDPDRVVRLLLEVAGAQDQLLKSPPPQALFAGFGASSLDFLLRAWTDRGIDEKVAMTSDLALAVHRALAAENIVIPFPQRDLHLASVSPGAAAALGDIGPKS